MLFSLLFLTKTEQPSNCPPFEQSALYLPVSFSFGSKIVESLAWEGLFKLKKNSIGAIINGIFIKKLMVIKNLSKILTSIFLLSSSTSYLYAEDRINNVTFTTKSSVVLMPCMDKTGTMMGGGPTKNEFCTETLNQLIRDGGAKTISWFKVNSQLQKVVNSSSSAAQTNPFLSGSSMGSTLRVDYTNDMYIPELIEASNILGAKYIVRPIVLNKESNRQSESDVGGVNAAILVPVVGGFLGQRKPKSTVTKSSNVTIKFDIISVPEEDIVATRSFSGDVNTTKETRGFSYDTNAFGAASGMDAGTRTAMTDAIYQGVEYLAERIK